MNKFIAIIFSLLTIFNAQNAMAQYAAESNENATILHKNGQIYLVVLVLVTIFAGIIFYLIRLEKKINKLEKKAHG